MEKIWIYVGYLLLFVGIVMLFYWLAALKGTS